jgi:hypothetical protein
MAFLFKGATMSDPALSSNDSFLAAFLDVRLAPAAFTHREHVRAAWLLVQRMPPDCAADRMCDALAILAQRCGAPEKFHRTVTEAFVRLIAGRGRAPSWEAFAAANTDLLLDGRRVLARYYSDALLDSTAARERFMPPDRDPLP